MHQFQWTRDRAIDLFEENTAKTRHDIENEVDRYIEQGAEILSAKILAETFAFQFDGLAYRINGLKLDPYKSLHWIERLEARVEKLRDVWDYLDQKFQTAQPDLEV